MRDLSIALFAVLKIAINVKMPAAGAHMILLDLGIAMGSAVSIAADDRVDNRIMYTVGKAMTEMNYSDSTVLWLGSPVNVSGKNIFFDRKH